MWCHFCGFDVYDRDVLFEFGLDLELSTSVVDGSFWAGVRQLALDPKARSSSVFRRLAGPFPREGRILGFPKMFWRFVDDFGSRSGEATFAVNFVRATLALSEHVTSQPSEGLTRFADRFETMGILRDASVESARQRTIDWALTDWMSDEVVGAEFRKTITPRSVNKFRSSVRTSLTSHLRGFEMFLQRDGRARALSVPIGFTRLPVGSGCVACAALKELQHVVDGCAAIQDVAAIDVNAFERAVTSTDVAGDELGSSNWPFVIGAELLARYGLDLRFTIHAGESFVTPFNGTRRVGELFLGSVTPSRVGHALGLSRAAADRVCRGGPPDVNRADAILDLCWAINCGLECSDEAHDRLYEVVAPVGGNAAIDVADWIEAARLLYSVEGAVSVGLLQYVAGRYLVRPREELLEMSMEGPGEMRAAVALSTCAPASISGCSMTDPLVGETQERFIRFGTNHAEAAREAVLSLVREHHVVLEACPRSNMVLSGLRGIDEHPIWEWLRADLEVSVSSDDPLVFGSTVTDEFKALASCDIDVNLVNAAAVISTKACSNGDRRRLKDISALRRALGSS
jgi:hypothetical protein